MNTTAVIVTYNTPELIYDCVKSLVKFYPALPILIIDNSDLNCECFYMCQNLIREYHNVRVHQTLKNIGHGRGLHLGINMCYSENVLIVDSDTELLSPCLRFMHEQLKENVYGVGQVVQVDETGHNVEKGMNYLHPHFALIKKKHYDNSPGFIHHGAPFIKTTEWLHNQNKLTVTNVSLKSSVLHKERGTRNVIDKMLREADVKGKRRYVVRASQLNTSRK